MHRFALANFSIWSKKLRLIVSPNCSNRNCHHFDAFFFCVVSARMSLNCHFVSFTSCLITLVKLFYPWDLVLHLPLQVLKEISLHQEIQPLVFDPVYCFVLTASFQGLECQLKAHSSSTEFQWIRVALNLNLKCFYHPKFLMLPFAGPCCPVPRITLDWNWWNFSP